MKFYQCTMEREEEVGKAVTTSWLPEKFARIGQVVKLQNRATKEWSDGWIIKCVSSLSREKSEVIERSQDHKRQRKASDI